VDPRGVEAKRRALDGIALRQSIANTHCQEMARPETADVGKAALVQ
jgi:hypothetical protein